MSICGNMATKRSILLGARIRFSPSGASIREQAIERIIEQSLASNDFSNGLSEQRLQSVVTVGGEIAVLRASDVKCGLDALERSGKVLVIRDGQHRRYTLTDEARTDVLRVITEAEERTSDIIRQLFGRQPCGEEAYRGAFLRLLCVVFSRLSDVYVQLITMEKTSGDIGDHQLLLNAIDETLKNEEVPDAEAFRYAAKRFFRETSPHFDHLKWNMAQNYYVAKALGMDLAADLLSASIFQNTCFYCDTNVLIQGLMPESRHHASFQELAKACGAIGVSLKATHATVVELRDVIDFHASMLRGVFDRIPDETRPKVRNFLLEAYLSERDAALDVTLDSFIERFQTPLQTLRESFGVDEEDDSWFNRITEDPTTKRLATELSTQYERMRSRRKAEKAATHDAVLLLWVRRQNEHNRDSCVVTLDATLAEWNTGRKSDGFKVITLDALLQWMTPVTSGSVDEEKLAEIFSKALRYQLLPRETFFQLSDFQVFAEMNIETKQLPADDVEACIREIRQAGPNLDPSKAEDREKISRAIQRYFADPGTKYRRNIEELQTKSDDLSTKLNEETRLRNEAEARIARLEKEVRERDTKLSHEVETSDAAEMRITGLEQKLNEQEKKEGHRRLVNSFLLRNLLGLFLLLVVEAFVTYLVSLYGEGPNLFQKLTKNWHWLALGFAALALAYPVLMGRERMRLLKWWKGETVTLETNQR